MACLLVNRIYSLHDMVAVKPHAELGYLEVISYAFADTYEQPLILWTLFVDLPAEEVECQGC